MAKPGIDGNITTDILARICETPNCNFCSISDICEIVPLESPEANTDDTKRDQ